ncbi:MAG TPA: WD40 repeat domain-containing protein [Anaerolineales bacterium]|nr:WD40 repeat domain-containing protein [Anaerolineales bacterium]
MKRILKISIALLVLVAILTAGCGASVQPTPSIEGSTSSVLETEPLHDASFTLEPPPATNTSVPTIPPTQIPVSTPTPMGEVITRENLSQLTMLKRFDRGAVQQVGYSADGKMMMVVTSLEVILYDAETLAEQINLKTDAVPLSAAISPEGSLLAVGYRDGVVNIWELKNGSIMSSFTDHDNQASAVAFSLDGKWFASGASDTTIFIRNTQDWKISHVLTRHTDKITQLTFSPDSTSLASSALDQTARLWNVEDGSLIVTLLGHTNQVKSVAYSPDGKYILTGSSDSSMRLWGAVDGALLQTVEEELNAESVAFSPDGEFIVAGILNNTIDVCRFTDGSISDCQLLGETYNGSISTISISPDGGQLISGGSAPYVRIWDFDELKIAAVLGGFAGTNYIRNDAMSPSLDMIAFSSSLDSLLVQNINSQAKNLELNERLASNPVFSSDGRKLANVSFRTIMVWDLETSELLHTVEGPASRILDVALSHNGELLAAASEDGTVHLWQSNDDNSHRILEGHTDGVSQVTFSPSGGLLASGGVDRSVRIWRVDRGELSFSFDNLEGKILKIKFSPNGSFLTAGTDTGVVYLWRVSDGERVWRERIDPQPAEDLAFHPNDQILAAITAKGEVVKFLDLEGGETIYSLTGTKNENSYNLDRPIASIAFSSDGTLLAVLTREAVMYYWGISFGDDQ